MKWTPLRGRKAQDKERARIEAALRLLVEASSQQRLLALEQLVALIRPRRRNDATTAGRRLGLLTDCVAANPEYAAGLRQTLVALLDEHRPIRLFTDSGILADEGFFTGLWRRVGQRLLPPERDLNQLSAVLHRLFPHRDDERWVDGIPNPAWIALLDALKFQPPGAFGSPQSTHQRMHLQMLEALQILSYRIAAIGLDPELVRSHPAIERYESPFVMQNVELRRFLEERHNALSERRAPGLDDRHLLVLLSQCEDSINKVWRQAAETGTSVRLTTLLARLGQCIERQKALLRLIEDQPAHELNVRRVELFKRLLRAETRQDSFGEQWSQTVRLLALRITRNASRTGEHYITESRAEYFTLFRSAMGAGFIVAFMALNKIAMSATAHPPFVEAVLHSLNYGLGFVLIFLLHFTIATKQPAMTASHIAHSMDPQPGSRASSRVEGLADLIVRTARSQFIAVVGNVWVAFVIAGLVGLAILSQTGAHAVNPERALKLLEDVSPLRSLAVPHAAVAGVCLFLAGLIAGYYDNRSAYNRIPQRIAQLRSLNRWLGPTRTQRLAESIGHRFGGIAGNFFFGCMLGSMGAIGDILGLPLDIRHITFAAANVAYSFVALQFQVPPALAAEAIIGVFVIGSTNLVVSFSLALYVAMKAQRVKFREFRPLLSALGKRFAGRPRDWFWPPP